MPDRQAAERRRAVESALWSLRAEGLEPTPQRQETGVLRNRFGISDADELAQGRVLRALACSTSS